MTKMNNGEDNEMRVTSISLKSNLFTCSIRDSFHFQLLSFDLIQKEGREDGLTIMWF